MVRNRQWLSYETKLNVYYAVVLPLFLYACDTWGFILFICSDFSAASGRFCMWDDTTAYQTLTSSKTHTKAYPRWSWTHIYIGLVMLHSILYITVHRLPNNYVLWWTRIWGPVMRKTEKEMHVQGHPKCSMEEMWHRPRLMGGKCLHRTELIREAISSEAPQTVNQASSVQACLRLKRG